MKVQSIVLALMVFSGVILGMTGFQGSLMENYGKEPNTENITSLEKSQEVDNKISDIQQSIQDFEVLNPLTWGNVVGLAISMFSILFEVPGIIHGIMTDVVTLIGLPGWFAGIVEGSLTIIFVFGAYNALRGSGSV